jgi:hypothetical protein
LHFGFFLLIGATLFPSLGQAGDHDVHHHDHESGSVEVGLSNSLVYIPGEQNFAYGLHVHALYTFAETPFVLGLGYELIAGEHLHQTVGPMFSYRPTDPLNLCVSPGLIFEDDNVALSVHVETTYEFELHGVYLGPTLGSAYNAEDIHISLGLHTGWQV